MTKDLKCFNPLFVTACAEIYVLTKDKKDLEENIKAYHSLYSKGTLN